MDIPLYALEGGMGAMLEKSIKVKLIKSLSNRLDEAGITTSGSGVSPQLGSLGKITPFDMSIINRIQAAQKRKAAVAKSRLKSVSRDLLRAKVEKAKAAVQVQISRDQNAKLKAQIEEKVQGYRERALANTQMRLAVESVSPTITKQEALRLAMPEIDKAARQIASVVKSKAAGIRRAQAVPFERRGRGPLPPVTVTPFDIALPRTRSPMQSLLYPPKGLSFGQFPTIDTREMDIQGFGKFATTPPPFVESGFMRPQTEPEWAKQYDSPEAAEMFGMGDTGDGDASESTQSDDWSNVVDVFPGHEEQDWDFDQNVIALGPPTNFNVRRLIRGGTKAAMRTIDQTGSVAQMNDNLKRFGIKPKPAGQPYTSAGNVAYDSIVKGLAKNKLISAAGNRPVAVKIKPKKLRKVLSAGYRKERQLRKERRKYLRWLGR